MQKEIIPCKFCDLHDGGRNYWNEDTTEYSSIEFALIPDPARTDYLLRARSFTDRGDLDHQDAVTIKFCPFCGRKLC